MDWSTLQREWDLQQETYLPDREQRFTALLDVIEATAGNQPRILDLAGGTGSITLRALARFADARSVIVDIDTALLQVAAGTFAGDDRVRIVTADLATPSWVDAIEDGEFDAIVTATALHWLAEERVAGVYAEATKLLRPGGVFANADHMADDGLPGLSGTLGAYIEARQEVAHAVPGATDWNGWWERLRELPELAEAVAAREAHFDGHGGSAHTESTMSSSWHIDALRAGGFAEAGLVWRGLTDAIVVGVR